MGINGGSWREEHKCGSTEDIIGQVEVFYGVDTEETTT